MSAGEILRAQATAIQRLTGDTPISVGHNPYAIAVMPDSMTVANDLRHRHAIQTPQIRPH